LCETSTEEFEITLEPPFMVPVLTEVEVILCFSGSTTTEVVAPVVAAQSPLQLALDFALDLPSSEMEKL
jgi:hypothetical protein